MTADARTIDVPDVEELLEIWNKARLVSQWADAIGSGPIEVLNAELAELWRLTHDRESPAWTAARQAFGLSGRRSQPATDALREALRHEYNAAIANGLITKARAIGRCMDALAQTPLGLGA